MKPSLQIPYYSQLSPKHKQRVNLVAGGLTLMSVALIVSNFIGGPAGPIGPVEEPPKPKPIGAAPGAQLDPRDAWMGSAGKDLAQLQDTVKEQANAQATLRGEIAQTRELLRAELRALSERDLNAARQGTPQAPAATQGDGSALSLPSAMPSAGPLPAPGRPPAPGPVAANQPQSFPGQSSVRAPGPNGAFPPGVPPAMGVPQMPSGLPTYPAAPPRVPVLMRVSMTGAAPDQGAAAPAAPGGTAQAGGATTVEGATEGAGRSAARRQVGSFMPVGFTRAVLLGGLAAPTGGQAQSNPVPVLLRLADLAELPNGFRGQVKDCLVVGEGFGDHSTERAYIRTTLLSCVMHDGQVLEVPVKGSVFGEDGMNGLMGTLVTKQGAILGSALLAGIASGIGSGIAQATQTSTSSTLGMLNSAPTDTRGILKEGLGTGVGKALDRLSQYYINLAERTFPAVEVQPGRVVDVVLTEGVSLEIALAAISPSGGLQGAAAQRTGNRAGLMQVLNGHEEADQ